jgi:nitroreductase
METLNVIFNRRSIRKYKSQAVEPEKIEQLLKAAMYAPSARNTQSWQFMVITERAILDEIRKVHPYAGMLKEATLAILVCGDKTLETNEGYLNTNCSAATQNILLAAYDLGLGSVWLGVYPREERMKGLSSLFQLPGHIIPISLIAIGYPAEAKEDPDRFLPERIHYNKW